MTIQFWYESKILRIRSENHSTLPQSTRNAYIDIFSDCNQLSHLEYSTTTSKTLYSQTCPHKRLQLKLHLVLGIPSSETKSKVINLFDLRRVN